MLRRRRKTAKVKISSLFKKPYKNAGKNIIVISAHYDDTGYRAVLDKPKACKFYKMGRQRSVPYKNRGAAIDDGCLDELFTEGRDEDE